MRYLPHREYKWILHLVDHWCKFQFVSPLVSKSASDVANALEKWVFPIIGLPSIVQSDNGREFVNQVIESVVATWPGQVQLVSGRPHHPQSQGLVEQAHYTLERMMSAKILDSGAEHPPWIDWLPHITCKYVCGYIHHTLNYDIKLVIFHRYSTLKFMMQQSTLRMYWYLGNLQGL